MTPTEKAARDILKMWRDLIDQAQNDPWMFRGERQAYHDSLEALRKAGAISSYDVLNMTLIP